MVTKVFFVTGVAFEGWCLHLVISLSGVTKYSHFIFSLLNKYGIFLQVEGHCQKCNELLFKI